MYFFTCKYEFNYYALSHDIKNWNCCHFILQDLCFKKKYNVLGLKCAFYPVCKKKERKKNGPGTEAVNDALSVLEICTMHI